MVHVTEWGSRHGCTLEAGLRRYRAQELIAESRVDLNTAMQVVRIDDAQWSCTIEAQRLDGQRSSLDLTLTLELTEGVATEYALALEFMFDHWSKDNYVLMPGAPYNGNRFDVRAMPNPPFPTSRDHVTVDGSVTIDVPRLSSGPGPSSIALLAGALLHSVIGGQADAVPSLLSDRLREFGERRGDSQLARSLGGEFVVATAKILQEREPGDDHLRRCGQCVTRASVVSRCLSRPWSASIRLLAYCSTWCQAAGTSSSRTRG